MGGSNKSTGTWTLPNSTTTPKVEPIKAPNIGGLAGIGPSIGVGVANASMSAAGVIDYGAYNNNPVAQPVPPSNGGCTNYENEYMTLQEKLIDEKIANEKSGVFVSADEAASENRREVEIRQAEADAEAEERRRRMKKGKRDIIYNDYTGFGALEEDDDDPFLLLGDN